MGLARCCNDTESQCFPFVVCVFGFKSGTPALSNVMALWRFCLKRPWEHKGRSGRTNKKRHSLHECAVPSPPCGAPSWHAPCSPAGCPIFHWASATAASGDSSNQSLKNRNKQPEGVNLLHSGTGAQNLTTKPFMAKQPLSRPLG